MGLNNQMYSLFIEMKKGYKNNDSGIVEQCARCWLQLAPDNPFKYDTPEYEEFFQMKKCFTIWTRGDIDQKINRRRMVQHAKALCALDPANPYKFDKEEAKRDEEAKKAKETKVIEEKKVKEQSKEDFQFVLLEMTNAYNENNTTSFEQYVIHLMDMKYPNPFEEGSEEFELYNEMVENYSKHNMRRVFVVSKDLCEVINHTEVKKEPKKIFGVLPDEKRSIFKLFRSRR